MATINVIQPTTPSGACPFAQLPHELMADVFMHLDPHTLYTVARQLNRNWKETTENHIIPMLFRSRQWRVALRVHRRPRRVHPASAAAASQPASLANNRGRVETESERAERVHATLGAWEDELLAPLEDPMHPPTITDYIPLKLRGVDAAANRFDFTTGADWYALYELDDRAKAGDDAFRLDLDFGIAWRFDGDGKEEEDLIRPGGWTRLDPENGWLSKFWCSKYDIKQQSDAGTDANAAKLNCTSLARRRRLPAPVPKTKGQPTPLQWDDKHLEYLHVDLSLGTEFFVRRSARANLLMRALEAEAARREEQEDVSQEEPLLPAAATAAAAAVAGSPKPFLHRPKPSRSTSGTSTPPLTSRGGAANANTLRPDMSPAEQLQMMARSKAAAKAAGIGTPSKSSGSRKVSRQGSAASSLMPSRAPSRLSSNAPSRVTSAAPSRAPSRPASPPNVPTISTDGGVDPGHLAITPSLLPTPAIPGTPVASPRDMPFFRAAALSLSTASPYTSRALSGYTTPTAAALRRGPSHSGGARRNRSAVRDGDDDGNDDEDDDDEEQENGVSTSAQAKHGGTPFAQFRGRLRRAQGFQPATVESLEVEKDSHKMLEGMNDLNLGAGQNGHQSHQSHQSTNGDAQSMSYSPEMTKWLATSWRTQDVSKQEGTGMQRQWRPARLEAGSRGKAAGDGGKNGANGRGSAMIDGEDEFSNLPLELHWTYGSR